MFNVPNLLTASNLICGILAIFLSFSGQLDKACYLIYLAAILDFFDGFLARKLNQMSELGKQLDSLADMLTFGVAPGFLMAIVMMVQLEGGLNPETGITFAESVFHHVKTYLIAGSTWEFGKVAMIFLAALVIPFFSLFRLAKFNIDTRQSESFIGLPTPANTIFFTSIPLLMKKYFDLGSNNEILEFILNPLVLMSIMLVFSILLIAELPLFSLKFKHFKFKGNEIKFIFLGTCALLIPTLLQWSIPMIIILYLLLSIFNNRKTAKA